MPPPRRSSTKGFKSTSALLQSRIRKATESRGFGETRLLTRWEEIAGSDIAAIARPVEISYSRGGVGATLTLLTTGPNAPLLEMQSTALRERINGVYGYNAISRIRITQTAPTGFAAGQVQFDTAGNLSRPAPEADAKIRCEAQTLAAPVGNQDLRKALEALGQNVLSRQNN